MSNQHVGEAIDFLKDLIEESPNTDRQQLLNEAADEYGVDPQFLSNRFSILNGPVVSYSAPTKTDSKTMDALRFAKAMAVSEKWAKQYHGRSTQFGTTFTFNGSEFIFVVVQSNQPKWGLKAVRVSDAAQKQFSAGAWPKIFKQLDEQGASK